MGPSDTDLWDQLLARLAAQGTRIGEVADCTESVLAELLAELGFTALQRARLQTEWAARMRCSRCALSPGDADWAELERELPGEWQLHLVAADRLELPDAAERWAACPAARRAPSRRLWFLPQQCAPPLPSQAAREAARCGFSGLGGGPFSIAIGCPRCPPPDATHGAMLLLCDVALGTTAAGGAKDSERCAEDCYRIRAPEQAVPLYAVALAAAAADGRPPTPRRAVAAGTASSDPTPRRRRPPAMSPPPLTRASRPRQPCQRPPLPPAAVSPSHRTASPVAIQLSAPLPEALPPPKQPATGHHAAGAVCGPLSVLSASEAAGRETQRLLQCTGRLLGREPPGGSLTREISPPPPPGPPVRLRAPPSGAFGVHTQPPPQREAYSPPPVHMPLPPPSLARTLSPPAQPYRVPADAAVFRVPQGQDDLPPSPPPSAPPPRRGAAAPAAAPPTAPAAEAGDAAPPPHIAVGEATAETADAAEAAEAAAADALAVAEAVAAVLDPPAALHGGTVESAGAPLAASAGAGGLTPSAAGTPRRLSGQSVSPTGRSEASATARWASSARPRRGPSQLAATGATASEAADSAAKLRRGSSQFPTAAATAQGEAATVRPRRGSSQQHSANVTAGSGEDASVATGDAPPAPAPRPEKQPAQQQPMPVTFSISGIDVSSATPEASFGSNQAEHVPQQQQQQEVWEPSTGRRASAGPGASASEDGESGEANDGGTHWEAQVEGALQRIIMLSNVHGGSRTPSEAAAEATDGGGGQVEETVAVAPPDPFGEALAEATRQLHEVSQRQQRQLEQRRMSAASSAAQSAPCPSADPLRPIRRPSLSPTAGGDGAAAQRYERYRDVPLHPDIPRVNSTAETSAGNIPREVLPGPALDLSATAPSEVLQAERAAQRSAEKAAATVRAVSEQARAETLLSAAAEETAQGEDREDCGDGGRKGEVSSALKPGMDFASALREIERVTKADFDAVNSKLEFLKGKMEATRLNWTVTSSADLFATRRGSAAAASWQPPDLIPGVLGPNLDRLADSHRSGAAMFPPFDSTTHRQTAR
eukprot:TRINITY_DN7009_c1_g1_i2.p1 TRINITY_DN7009_c1_g1~~TRINITY_DN7009_c1_g1_i2.p1  ORF type:complete len:1080 (+),score=199.19 TRINITY_DN7009_c1_g1_i2:83-3241(+)